MIFEPLVSPLFSTTSLSILTFLLSLAGMIFFFKTKKVSKHYRNIFSLLLFFAGMMSMGSALFGWFYGERIGQVKVEENQFETAYGAIPFSSIKNILLKKESLSNSLMTPSVTTDYHNRLIIISNSNQFYFFSEENYPIKKMISPMRKAWQTATKKGAPD